MAQLFGLGVATVHNIVKEVCEAIIRNLWKVSVQAHFPTTEQNFKEKMVDMEMLWQFPSSWGAIDGCHIPIQCPPGGLKACKEYHNFKNFYSIVMMAVVMPKTASSGQVLVSLEIRMILLSFSQLNCGMILLKTISYHQLPKQLEAPRFIQ